VGQVPKQMGPIVKFENKVNALTPACSDSELSSTIEALKHDMTVSELVEEAVQNCIKEQTNK
jgi:hypothetical protein